MSWNIWNQINQIIDFIGKATAVKSFFDIAIQPLNDRRKKRKEQENREWVIGQFKIIKLDIQINYYDDQINALGQFVSPLTACCFILGIYGSLSPIWLWVKAVGIFLGILTIIFIDKSSTKRRKKLALEQEKQQLMDRLSML